MSCGPGTTAMAFDVTNPEAVAWARTQSSKLITEITAEARAAIRETVAMGFENGIPPRDLAKLIKANIGLTERNAKAVMRQHLADLADGMKSKAATARAEAYANRLLRSRARTIARTEMMKAANEGQSQLWGQAREAGLLSGKEKKVWITADPCPICAPLEGETVGVNESFSIGTDPPAHPNCRCTIGLVG